MKKSNISAIVMVALVGAAYVSSTLKNDSSDVAPPISGSSLGCDPNYSGCVPIASDVDCAGGPGNGPEYVEGPITVIGTDIYQMDGDEDGIACE